MNGSSRIWIMLIGLCSMMTLANPLSAYQEDPNVAGVLVKGRVIYSGNVPEAPSLSVNRDQAFCGESIPDHSLLVDEPSKGISQVVVNLKGIGQGKGLPTKAPLKMDNRNCQFQPSVSVGVTGNILEIQSADPVLHNTHILQDEETFLNVALPPGGRTIRKPLSQPGRLNVRCDAHQFMRASIHIFDHPYFTKTNKTGDFELTQVPPGNHTIQFWHRTLGMKELSITVKPSTPLVVTVTYP